MVAAALVAGAQAVNASRLAATGRTAVAFPAAWLPWVLVGTSAAAALFGAWRIWGAQAAVAFLAAWWPWLLIGAAAAVVLSVFVWWLWWRLPRREVDRRSASITDPKARADVEDNIRKTMGQLLGGAAVLLGAAFAYLQFQQQQTSAHDLLISNQVAKGFELLGHKDGQIEQRLGGIYALEGVMNTSKEYYQPVLEALCAYIRERAAETSKEATGNGIRPLASDIRAALNVIGRRILLGEAVPDLRGVRFPKADLTFVNLIKADLRGANLTGADLTGANLTGAFLSADLSNADLSNAKLSGAILLGAKLSGANLLGADLGGADLTGASLTGADLTEAKLSGTNLRGTPSLTQQQLDEACGDKNTKLNPGLTIKPCP